MLLLGCVTGVCFKVSKAHARTDARIPMFMDIELSATFLASCLSVHCHAPCHGDNGLSV